MTNKLKFKDLNYINFTKKELDELFAFALEGNSKAFSDLSGYIRNISFSYFQSKYKLGKIDHIEDVEDLANNVYLAFAEQYHKIENIEFWLRRVLFLNFINWYKKNHIKNTFELKEARYVPDKGYNPGEAVDADRILELLNTLSKEKQLILKKRFWEDLKFSEIASYMNKSEDAVKKMFYRTIDELKGMI